MVTGRIIAGCLLKRLLSEPLFLGLMDFMIKIL
jgi:hypothetical protein